MNTKNFETTIHAKCILCGEHAILRGRSAIVVPVHSKAFKLKFQQTGDQCQFDYENTPCGETLLILFENLFQHALSLMDKSFKDVGGKFILENNIPIGYGLGFSAAACVSLTKWMIWKKWIEPDNLFVFSQKLEDFYHGKSSGVDIAGVLAENPIIYLGNGVIKKINPKWNPDLYLSNTNLAAKTSECVEQVARLWKDNITLAQSIDDEMEDSVTLAQQALLKNKKTGLTKLQKAIEISNVCFQRWGLINEEMDQHMKMLIANQAMAVKPTGGGGGGYVLSLWDNKPSQKSNLEMIPLL